jgi:hypothetical protein
VESDSARAGQPALPRRRGPDLAGYATFSLSAGGVITGWSLTAAELFGQEAKAVIGQDVCDVLLTGPGQDQLIGHALAEVAAGRVWASTVAGGSLGDGRFAIRLEPAAGPDGGVLVLAQQAWPQTGPTWLSEAAARIGRTLDLLETAAEVADVAVPGFADVTVLYASERLLSADELGSPMGDQGVVVRRLAARLAGQEVEITNGLMPAGEVIFLAAGTPRARAMVTGEPVQFDRLDDQSARRLGRRSGSGDDPASGNQIAAGFTFLAVPLTARGKVVGCVVFGREPGAPEFGPGEIVLASELASLAAVSLDNARLYDRERRTALALQRGLLPGQPQIPDGLDVAQVYRPVGASVVGGDWHDIVPLPGGRAVLMVGDAMGHGPEAAAVMVQLRTAAHILADMDVSPEETLRRLDRMVAGMPGAPFATCIAVVMDPVHGSCLISQAGHLPPVLVLADGSTQMLDLPTGLPLGLGGENFEVTRISLPPGATLALYTDGLVESRTRTLDNGMTALRQSLSVSLAGPGTLRDACNSVTEALRDQGEDDITLLLARVRQ